MSYSPELKSCFNDTKMRSSTISTQNGMCSFCSADCLGTCEIGLSAIRGAQSVYPTNTGDNQVASEKNYPFDYSHFNINGRVFGAMGVKEDNNETTIFNVNLEQTIGSTNPVKMALPIILPALLKMNWPDYFSGAAMAGISCVIGEDSYLKDPKLKMENNKVVEFPMLETIVKSFNDYYRGYGQIILQVNTENDVQGLIEYATKVNLIEAIEFKFGQSAKGTQPVVRLANYEAACAKKALGGLVHPDPDDEKVKQLMAEGITPNFYNYGRCPMWDEEFFKKRIAKVRALGIKNIYFKMAGYDYEDIRRVIKIAIENEVDFITFDGAGGGSGYSPCKMMNEWSYPPIDLEKIVHTIMSEEDTKNKKMPAIAITGGFSMEDHVFKALALGAPYINFVGICRATMAAANSAKNIGELIEKGTIPTNLQQYGSSLAEIFTDLADLRVLYGKKADAFPPGAIGVYSYLNRLKFGLQHFAALNRKFDISYLDQSDLIPLTKQARKLLKK